MDGGALDNSEGQTIRLAKITRRQDKQEEQYNSGERLLYIQLKDEAEDKNLTSFWQMGGGRKTQEQQKSRDDEYE